MKTKNNKKREKCKMNRKISIITVFLWIFLIMTMIIIVNGNIKNTNALEDTTDSYNIEKSAFSEFYPNKNVYNFVKDGIAQTGKGEIYLDIQNPIAKDVVSTYYYGENYVGSPKGYYDVIVKENSNERIAIADVYSIDDKIVVEFEAGEESGLTTIIIEYKITDLDIKVGNPKETVTSNCISGELEYKVIVYSNEDFYSNIYSRPTYNLNLNVGEIERRGIYFLGYYNDYADEILGVDLEYDNNNIVEILNTEFFIDYEDIDSYGFTYKSTRIFFKGINPGKTQVIMNIRWLYDGEKYTTRAIYNITVTGEEKVDITFANDEDDSNSTISLDKTESLVIPGKMSNKDWSWVIGWSTTPNSKYVDYHVGEEYTFNENKTLYPVWENFQSVKKTIVANKIWDDNNNLAKKRPESVTLQVKADGEVVEEQEVSEESGWSYPFLVQKYEKNGEEVVYTVDEKESNDLYIKNVVGYTVTNKFVVPEDKIKIVGKKVWEDKDNIAGKREKSVILQLKVEDKVISEGEVSDKNNWSYEFEAKKYDDLGNEIKYYIDEKETSKFYEKELIDETTVKNIFRVPEDKVMIKVTKIWEDDEDEYKKRPKNVVLQVFDGENLVAEEVVSDTTNWSFEFNLPKYNKLGDEIKYRVDEKETAKYYEKTIDGNTIINKCIYDPIVDTSDINIWLYVGILVIAMVVIVIVIMFIKRKPK